MYLPRSSCTWKMHVSNILVSTYVCFAGQAMQIKGYRRGFRLRLLPDDGITCAHSLWRTVKFVPIVSDMQKMWRLPSYARLSAFTEHEPQTVTVTSRNVSRRNFWIIMVNIFDSRTWYYSEGGGQNKSTIQENKIIFNLFSLNVKWKRKEKKKELKAQINTAKWSTVVWRWTSSSSSSSGPCLIRLVVR